MWIDFVEFERYVLQGQRLEQEGATQEALKFYGRAEGLYQGDFFAEDLYEDWTHVQREQLRSQYLQIIDRLSAHYFSSGEYVAAVALCQKALKTDPCYEAAHCCLMQSYLAQGQRYLAVRQYQTCVQALEEELGVSPSENTTRLFNHLVANKK